VAELDDATIGQGRQDLVENGEAVEPLLSERIDEPLEDGVELVNVGVGRRYLCHEIWPKHCLDHDDTERVVLRRRHLSGDQRGRRQP
jgi:hypothetical protein